jgi:hypothetical protein
MRYSAADILYILHSASSVRMLVNGGHVSPDAQCIQPKVHPDISDIAPLERDEFLI